MVKPFKILCAYVPCSKSITGSSLYVQEGNLYFCDTNCFSKVFISSKEVINLTNDEFMAKQGIQGLEKRLEIEKEIKIIFKSNWEI